MHRIHTRTILGAASLAAALFATGCQPSDDSLTSKSALSGSNDIDINEVPAEIHRRVAQLLEDVRGTDSAPGWDRADIDRTVRILQRPDIQGPAYYEFHVSVDGRASGYIIATSPGEAGDHDFPVTHWDFAGSAPTQSLDELAQGKEIAAYYKLDSLSYVAVGPDGEMVANLGALPPRITGQDPSWLDDPLPDTSTSWIPDQTSRDDGSPGRGGRTVLDGPATPAPIELGSWDSIGQLVSEYRESYATMIESLRRQAADEWDTERFAADNGEGVIEGEPLPIALLFPGATIEVSGEGASLVAVEVIPVTPATEALSLEARSSVAGREIPFTLTASYPNGTRETLSFVILSPEDVGSGSVGAKRDNVNWAELGPNASWGPWNQFWAGTSSDQRLYSQMAAGSSPNTSGCYSGCGATAWAMLFGWGDYQAGVGNPSWSHRWGLYRQNGGYGTNVVAPKYMDTGVRNMTWEIRNRVGTFCAFGSGATFPWEMGDAQGYLTNRSGASVGTNYNVLGIHTDGLRNKARDSIVNRKVPAIIGTGWLSHYPLAYGYRWRKRTVKKCILFICWNETEYQRQFYVNQGWGGSGNGWVNAGTWFAGQLYAN